MCLCGTEQTTSSFHQKCNLILTMPYGIAERIAHLTLNSYHSYSFTSFSLECIALEFGRGSCSGEKKVVKKTIHVSRK